MHSSIPSSLESRESWIQGQPRLHNKLKATLNYIVRFCLPKTIKWEKKCMRWNKCLELCDTLYSINVSNCFYTCLRCASSQPLSFRTFKYVVTMEQVSGSKLDICSFCTIFKETPSWDFLESLQNLPRYRCSQCNLTYWWHIWQKQIIPVVEKVWEIPSQVVL